MDLVRVQLRAESGEEILELGDLDYSVLHHVVPYPGQRARWRRLSTARRNRTITATTPAALP